jgi:hypothetical protein
MNIKMHCLALKMQKEEMKVKEGQEQNTERV